PRGRGRRGPHAPAGEIFKGAVWGGRRGAGGGRTPGGTPADAELPAVDSRFHRRFLRYFGPKAYYKQAFCKAYQLRSKHAIDRRQPKSGPRSGPLLGRGTSVLARAAPAIRAMRSWQWQRLQETYRAKHTPSTTCY